jgi:hypothetical protein
MVCPLHDILSPDRTNVREGKGGGSAGNLKGCILQMLADDTAYARGGTGGRKVQDWFTGL